MKKEIIICIVAILLIFYFTSPAPYCKISEERFYLSDAMYSFEETLEIKETTAILLNVKGASMLPTIQDGSKCLCVKKESYGVGNIIFFFAEINDTFHGISHRIVSIENDKVFTKGDANNWTDPPMTKESVVCAIPEIPRWKTFI